MSAKCNAKCPYNIAGGGCRLFSGVSWLQCRHATTKSDLKPQSPKKGKKHATYQS